MDDGFGLVVVFVFVVPLLVASLLARYLHGRRRTAVLRAVAPHVDGIVVSGGPFHWQPPELRFGAPGQQVRLQFYSTGGKHPTHYTRLLADLSVACGFTASLHPLDFLSEVGKLLGMQDIEVGDPLLDDEFIVKGSDADRVRAFLSSEVRRAVFELRSPPFNDHLAIHAEGNTLRVDKRTWIEDPHKLRRYIALCEKIIDGYRAAAT